MGSVTLCSTAVSMIDRADVERGQLVDDFVLTASVIQEAEDHRGVVPLSLPPHPLCFIEPVATDKAVGRLRDAIGLESLVGVVHQMLAGLDADHACRAASAHGGERPAAVVGCDLDHSPVLQQFDVRLDDQVVAKVESTLGRRRLTGLQELGVVVEEPGHSLAHTSLSRGRADLVGPRIVGRNHLVGKPTSRSVPRPQNQSESCRQPGSIPVRRRYSVSPGTC